MYSPPFTDAELKVIRELAAAGMTANEIARKLGRTRAGVWRFAFRRGIEIRNGRNALSDDEIIRIETLAGEGFNATAIGRVLDRTPSTINRWARAMGIGFERASKGEAVRVTLHFQPPEFFTLKCHADRRAMRPGHFCRLLIGYCLAGGGEIADNLFDLSS